MKSPKVVSLFSGCGGMDLGFIQAGFEIIWANDNNKDSVKTYIENIGNHIICKDITQVENSEIPEDFEVLIGGFPCQGFSIANNKRSMEDKRNHLYKEIIRIIKAKRPKFFLMENVKGLLSMEKGKVIEMIVNDFKELGYVVDYKILKASDYGVPQNRERVIIMGNRLGVENTFPIPTHGYKLKHHITVKESIEHLSEIRTRDVEFTLAGKKVYNHIARTNVSDIFWKRKNSIVQSEICDYLKHWKSKTKWTIKGIDEHFGYSHTAGHWFRKDKSSGSIPNPKDWWELKKLLGFDDTYDKQVTELEPKEIKFEQSLRISNWETPSDTITASGPEIHPNKLRRISVRECAILQTFPEDFIFYGSLSSMYRQVGNAVPVLLSKKIAEQIFLKLKS